MSLYFEFPSGWWAILAFIYISYLILFLQRKSYKKKNEMKSQYFFSFVAVVVAFFVEIIAISLRVWTYYPGNWPIILWIGYYGSGLLSYQLVKKIEEVLG